MDEVGELNEWEERLDVFPAYVEDDDGDGGTVAAVAVVDVGLLLSREGSPPVGPAPPETEVDAE